MAVINGQLFFAPGIPMRDLDLDDPAALLSAFERHVKGLFLSPIRVLANRAESEEGALFSSALLVAALIESIARIDLEPHTGEALITVWLKTRLSAFQETININGQDRSLAAVFEERFRNGLAHHGYVASLGRLSSAIDVPVRAVGQIVTVNPFALAEAVAERFKALADELQGGTRDIRRFAHVVRELFGKEVECARREASA